MRKIEKRILVVGIIIILILYAIIAIQFIGNKPIPKPIIIFSFFGGALIGTAIRLMFKNNKLNKKQFFLIISILFLILIFILLLNYYFLSRLFNF